MSFDMARTLLNTLEETLASAAQTLEDLNKAGCIVEVSDLIVKSAYYPLTFPADDAVLVGPTQDAEDVGIYLPHTDATYDDDILTEEELQDIREDRTAGVEVGEADEVECGCSECRISREGKQWLM